jgi:ABC-type Fe3+ transport system substrate-binding protein
MADELLSRWWPDNGACAKNAPHPNAARIFIDYVLSEEGQRLLAQLGRTVVRPGIEIKHPRLGQSREAPSRAARGGEEFRGNEQTLLRDCEVAGVVNSA